MWVFAYTNICIWTHVHEQVSEYRERLQAAKDNVMLVRDGMSAKITAANRRARASEDAVAALQSRMRDVLEMPGSPPALLRQRLMAMLHQSLAATVSIPGAGGQSLGVSRQNSGAEVGSGGLHPQGSSGSLPDVEHLLFQGQLSGLPVLGTGPGVKDEPGLEVSAIKDGRGRGRAGAPGGSLDTVAMPDVVTETPPAKLDAQAMQELRARAQDAEAELLSCRNEIAQLKTVNADLRRELRGDDRPHKVTISWFTNRLCNLPQSTSSLQTPTSTPRPESV